MLIWLVTRLTIPTILWGIKNIALVSSGETDQVNTILLAVDPVLVSEMSVWTHLNYTLPVQGAVDVYRLIISTGDQDLSIIRVVHWVDIFLLLRWVKESLRLTLSRDKTATVIELMRVPVMLLFIALPITPQDYFGWWKSTPQLPQWNLFKDTLITLWKTPLTLLAACTFARCPPIHLNPKPW